jgi:tellurite resistance protein
VQFNPDEAESALALAAAVALADNEVSTTEDDFVTELAAAFGFTDETVQRVLDQLAQD